MTDLRKNIVNFRDLGGIKTKDGHKVAEKKLLRSGTLFFAEEEDLKRLKEEYHLKTIIDLRSQRERKAMPDPCMKGVSNIWNPILMEGIQGMEPDEILDEIAAKGYMKTVYQKFVNNQIIQKQFKQFFSILYNHRDGAILWHCSEGKDRVGVCSALLLSILGVSRKDIIEEYNRCEYVGVEKAKAFIDRLYPGDVPGNAARKAKIEKLMQYKSGQIEVFFDAIEKDYITVENYLQKALEIRVYNILHLRERYLN